MSGKIVFIALILVVCTVGAFYDSDSKQKVVWVMGIVVGIFLKMLYEKIKEKFS